MINLPTQQCPLCDGPLVERDTPSEIHLGHRRATVPDHYHECEACGEQLYAPGQMAATQMLASDKIRDEEGLLRSSRIHSIRTELGLTQQQFEQLLGVGPKTVVRWEKGTVFQNRATDSLIRLVAEVPGVAAHLAQRHGVEIAIQRAPV